MSSPITNTKKLGNQGELFVSDHLQKLGFIICKMNYRKFFGEIDIIAHKKELYIFVEVKTRTSSTVVPLEHLISISKQQKIIKTAQTFIAEQQLGHHIVYRFDVALLKPDQNNFLMTYIPNAFINSSSRTYEYE